MRRALLLVAPALSSALGCAGSEDDDGGSAEAALAGAGASGRLVALEPQPEVTMGVAPLEHWQVALGEPGQDVSSGGVARRTVPCLFLEIDHESTMPRELFF